MNNIKPDSIEPKHLSPHLRKMIQIISSIEEVVRYNNNENPGLPVGINDGDILLWKLDSGKWVAAVPDFLTTETDPIFTAWNKDYNDLTNKPETMPSGDEGNSIFHNGTNWYATSGLSFDIATGYSWQNGDVLPYKDWQLLHLQDYAAHDYIFDIKGSHNPSKAFIRMTTTSGLSTAFLEFYNYYSGGDFVNLDDLLFKVFGDGKIMSDALTASKPLKSDANKNIISGDFGSNAGDFAEGNHTHTGLLPAGTSGQTLRYNASNVVVPTDILRILETSGNVLLGKFSGANSYGILLQHDSSGGIKFTYLGNTTCQFYLVSGHLTFWLNAYNFKVSDAGVVTSLALAGTGERDLSADVTGNIVTKSGGITQQGLDINTTSNTVYLPSDIAFSLKANTNYELDLNLIFDLTFGGSGSDVYYNIELYTTSTVSVKGVLQSGSVDSGIVYQAIDMSNSTALEIGAVPSSVYNPFNAKLTAISSTDATLVLKFKLRDLHTPPDIIKLLANSFGSLRK